jgi:CHAD domain-containing protein
MAVAELVAPERPGVEAIEQALDGRFTVRPGAAVTRERVLLDTFDGLLRAERLSLRWEDGAFELRREGEERPVAVGPGGDPRGPVPVATLPAGTLRDAIVDVVEVRALLPRARVRVTTQTLAFLDELDKTVARLSIEVPELLLSGRRTTPLSTRLTLRGLRGYEDQERAIETLLGDALAAAGAERPLSDEAVLAAGGRPEGISSKVDVPLRAGERADRAAVRVLEALMEVIEANLPGTIADIDSEFLHDLRVSVRRTRAVQRELKRVFPPEHLRRMRDGFKWVQQVTGDARDLDVYVLGFDSMRSLVDPGLRADLEPLLAVLRQRRLTARREMVRELRSERSAALWREWRALLGRLEQLADDERPDAARPIEQVTGGRIRRVYRKMVKMGRAIDADSPPEEYHELRKKGKELRYLLELFAQPIHDPAIVKPMVKTLKGLQDVLGHHQDREVQMTMLRGLRDAVAAQPGGPAALMAMGVLIERLEEDAAASRAEFAERFSAFAAREQRALVRRTFPAP